MNLVAPPNVGEIIDGKYILDAQLGQGGMGTVFAGRSMSTGERVAIKVMLDVGEETEDVRKRFMNEAHLAGRIDSPHVARPRDSGFHQGLPYIAMELMEGEDVETTLIRRKILPIQEAIDITVEIADALALAHEQGIIHRDIKPANVFLARTPDGRVTAKLLDFGISKAPPGVGNPSLTKTSSVMGSPMYMSPEQLKSTKGVDARTDVWSLAIVLYEALTGDPPFEGGSFAALFSSILMAEIPPVRKKRPDCPAPVEEAIHQALARDREKRTQTIAEFALAIAPFGSARIASVLARFHDRMTPHAADSDRTVIAPENSQEGMMEALDPVESERGGESEREGAAGVELEGEGAPDSDRDRTVFSAGSPYTSDPRMQAGAPVVAAAVQPTHPAPPLGAPPATPGAPAFGSHPNMPVASPLGAQPFTQAMEQAPQSQRAPFGSNPSNPQMPVAPVAQPGGPHALFAGTVAMPMSPQAALAHHAQSNPHMPVASPAFAPAPPMPQAINAPPVPAPWAAAQNTPQKQGPNVILIVVIVGALALFLSGLVALIIAFGSKPRAVVEPKSH